MLWFLTPSNSQKLTALVYFVYSRIFHKLQIQKGIIKDSSQLTHIPESQRQDEDSQPETQTPSVETHSSKSIVPLQSSISGVESTNPITSDLTVNSDPATSLSSSSEVSNRPSYLTGWYSI